MDPAIAGAWIGFGGGVTASLGGALIGYKLAAWSQQRANRDTAVQQLAGLRQYLYAPHDLVDLREQLDRHSIALSAAGIGEAAITALRTISELCLQSSQALARANPEIRAVNEDLLTRYNHLFDALPSAVRRTGKPTQRTEQLRDAVQGVEQLAELAATPIAGSTIAPS